MGKGSRNTKSAFVCSLSWHLWFSPYLGQCPQSLIKLSRTLNFENLNQACPLITDTMDDWLKKTLLVMVWGTFNRIWSIKFGKLVHQWSKATHAFNFNLYSLCSLFTLSLFQGLPAFFCLCPRITIMIEWWAFCNNNTGAVLMVVLFYYIVVSFFVLMKYLTEDMIFDSNMEAPRLWPKMAICFT